MSAQDSQLTRTADSPKPIELNEVTVTASKVKFYHKGDTLVYNADAFVLPEGSMLDALVARLPGVELRSDGSIYCNGRYVKELLLNGRDLFNGDKKLMLDNLATYTVKDVAVYDKLGRNSELMGTNVGDSRYVMDVRLKREYAIGWLGNFELGAAIGDRYLGRLFAMWYNDKASVTLHAGANNMSGRTQSSSNTDGWQPETATSRDSRYQDIGINYTWKDNGKWEVKGDVKYEGTKTDDASEVRQINFFDSGDTYSYKWDDRLSRRMLLSTNHNIFTKISNKANLTFSPTFVYNNSKSSGDIIEGSFTGDIKDMSRQILADIYNTDGTAVDSMIYRNLSGSRSKSRSTLFALSGESFIALSRPTPGGSLGSSLTLKAYIDRSDARSNDFNRYLINRGANPVPDEISYQYRDGSPTSSSNLRTDLVYSIFPKRNLSIALSYGYNYSDIKQSSMMYHLEDVEGFDAANTVLGYLPSMREYAPTLDPELSYRSQMRTHSNRIGPSMSYFVFNKKGMTIETQLNGSIEVLSRDYTYVQQALDRIQHLNPTDLLYSMSARLSFNHRPDDNWAKRINIDINLQTKSRDLYSMVDVDNNADPLNVYKGNPDLKNGKSLTSRLVANFTKPRSKVSHNVRVNYNAYFDKLAKGIEYDPTSGVRTYRTYNVNGNWDLSGEYSLSFNLGKGFEISSSTNGNFCNSVDLIGSGVVEGAQLPESVVKVSTVGAQLRANWSKNRFNLMASVSGNWIGYSSSDRDVAGHSALTFNAMLSGNVHLPYNWGITSDVSLYGRRGYSDRKLNSSDVIWNARIAKTILKNKVVLIVDVYDLLRQYNKVNYLVNAQAQVEQLTATLPRYILFHIQYRFNKPPKKAKPIHRKG